MKILHYTLGLSPYRTGGLTKYSTDLIIAEVKSGDEVYLLYPSDLTWGYPFMKLQKNREFRGVKIYELKNPMPIPLLHGVKSPLNLMNETTCCTDEFLKLLDCVSPDVLHVHTLMGLPQIFLKEAKKRMIHLVYTTHDYFGLCLKVNFINQFGLLCKEPSSSNCALCNSNSPSTCYLRFRNEKWVLKLKDLLRKPSNKLLLKEKIQPKVIPKIQAESIIAYQKLLDYYKKSFSYFDYFHFNSFISKEVFESCLGKLSGEVIPITHNGIKDCRKKKFFCEEKLQICFIGNTSPYKGFDLLRKQLMLLQKNGIYNWNLNVWGGGVGVDDDCNQIHYQGKYKSDQLDAIYNKIDLLVVPSIWKETFSLITLEALSYGVPVLVSNNVGAKDIVAKYSRDFIFSTSKDLYCKLQNIMNNRELLGDYNNAILNSTWNYSQYEHVREIRDKIYQ